MSYFKFKIGDLVKHTTILPKLNRGYGVVVDVIAVEYDKINTIKCAWYDGKSSWIHKGQLKLITRGQDGELS
jgi:hypothetical protein|tara:strand:+ start:88 stop:303 length:216 start_codon:yes stop_codon:yes gene_type:complete